MPSNRYLNRSKLASTRLCNNHIYAFNGKLDSLVQNCHDIFLGHSPYVVMGMWGRAKI